MRKIEQQMNSAIRYRRNWAGSNTMVRVYKEVVEVFLHGNHIASLDTATHKLTIKDGGWQSNTTKSRLNAICNEFLVGARVFQKNFNWFLQQSRGIVRDFDSGMSVMTTW